MQFKLSTSIKEGQKIKTASGWRKVKAVTDSGVQISDGAIYFGDIIYGWKRK